MSARLALHAWKIQYASLDRGGTKNVVAPVAEDLREVVARFKNELDVAIL